MKCINFNTNIHLPIINKWLEDRKLEPVDKTPSTGYIVYHKKVPIAAGFLRRVEGGFAQIDGLVTNPYQPSELRDQANDIIASQLINTAKELGIKGICCYSRDKNTIIRGSKHGFEVLPHVVIVLSLHTK